MIYIKFSNGSTTRLINMHNEVAQREAEEDGFQMVMGEDGVPETVDSSALTMNKMESERSLLIKKISEKLAQ